MNDSIEKYLNKSKKNLNTIIESLETNIEFLDNELWNSYDEIKDKINNIVDIYYDKYYLYVSKDFSKIDKYIKFSNKINRKLKTILLSIIDYYENINEAETIKNKEGSILYLTILIYVALTLYDKEFITIDSPKKIEKVINNIIDNFARIRFKKEKDLVTLISNIKEVVEENNKFNDYLDSLNTKESHNIYMSINKDKNYYKSIYECKISELDDYDERDITIVNNKININSILSGISYDIAYYTMFKLLINGLDYTILFPISKKNLMNDTIRNFMVNRNKNIVNKIKFLVDYDEIESDYEFINMMKFNDIDIFIEVNDSIETSNYNMFMDVQNIVVTEEFISINEKYVEIWKDMNMNFITKNLGNRLTEKRLISRK